MAPAEFVARTMRLPVLPWRRWRSDWAAADCFGGVCLYWREVLGIDLGPVPRTDIAAGFAGISGWVECPPAVGTTGFMSWRDGVPTHCGVLALPGYLWHVQEGHPVPESGGARLTRLAVMQRMCPDLRFYRYEAPAAC
jgi:hypothetical protein